LPPLRELLLGTRKALRLKAKHLVAQNGTADRRAHSKPANPQCQNVDSTDSVGLVLPSGRTMLRPSQFEFCGLTASPGIVATGKYAPEESLHSLSKTSQKNAPRR